MMGGENKKNRLVNEWRSHSWGNFLSVMICIGRYLNQNGIFASKFQRWCVSGIDKVMNTTLRGSG